MTIVAFCYGIDCNKDSHPKMKMFNQEAPPKKEVEITVITPEGQVVGTGVVQVDGEVEAEGNVGGTVDID